ncbi:MAG TPA: UDP-glucose--hexose-1-phosphate uridylyltransferase [Candidatus Limousia pullorum]|uniref:Galactose-1-phosphate uridylyltransferase n=1 Tax=Candidatus Limousia pullorum TaxID=2840860 RepID=A0A9D1LZ69_9FIRM|nr:UDP-glucose--hexose-1-phosphate uridylyltransferase [Candidatus Limousia pullorum]
MISTSVKKLVKYALDNELIKKADEIYITNILLGILKVEDFDSEAEIPAEPVCLEKTLGEILDYAVENGIIEDGTVSRDLFDTKLMGVLTPRPSAVIDRFFEEYAKTPEKATDYYYKLSQDSDYIRRYRIVKDMKWKTPTEYGDIDITINLSKPEKDPKAIAAAKNAVQSSYPKCLLCPQTEGYAGNMSKPARQNHRIIPIVINDSPWGFQYSPYVYYNEHCIVFNQEHTPMKIDSSVFRKLFDFVRQFPHYFVGSNADLPIVGGSILSHEHFQGGRYTFAMAKAPIEIPVTFPGFENVTAGIVKWPMSVIRLSCADEAPIIELAAKILANWREYTDEAAYIYAYTDGERHNTITPIARKNGDNYELDLVLRNNITTEERPMGLYHPRNELHHIKKENIGLIEVMGLAVLPSRLKGELDKLGDFIIEGKDIRSDADIEKHADWTEEILKNHKDMPMTKAAVSEMLCEEVGKVFLEVLKDAGVYKDTAEGREAFMRFINSVR